MSDGTVLAVIATGLVLGAAVVWYRGRQFLARAVSSTADVVAVRTYSEQRTTRYVQVCRFQVDGRETEAELKAGLPLQAGAKVEVFFERSNPDRIRVKSQVYRPAIILLVFAAFAAVAWLGAQQIG